jgi:hypothetical protein
MFMIGLLFLFIKLSINYTNGYLLHWANYSASRAYLTFDDNTTNPLVKAKVHAKTVFDSFLNIIPNVKPTLQFNDPETGKNFIYIGTFADFEQTFSMMAFVGGNDPLSYRTESFLGKEPHRQECLKRICDQFKQQLSASGAGCPTLENATYFDDGC